MSNASIPRKSPWLIAIGPRQPSVSSTARYTPLGHQLQTPKENLPDSDEQRRETQHHAHGEDAGT